MGRGWKGKAGAILTILGGFCGGAIYFVLGPEATSALTPTEALAIITAGFSLFGIRDAIE